MKNRTQTQSCRFYIPGRLGSSSALHCFKQVSVQTTLLGPLAVVHLNWQRRLHLKGTVWNRASDIITIMAVNTSTKTTVLPLFLPMSAFSLRFFPFNFSFIFFLFFYVVLIFETYKPEFISIGIPTQIRMWFVWRSWN